MSIAFLRLVSGSGNNSYSLLATGEIVIGRDPNCQIVLSSNLYGMVSRRHASIRPSKTPDGRISYVLWDLNSANGTFLNGYALQGSQELQVGDRVMFGSNGPEFVFEYQHNQQSVKAPQPVASPTQVAAKSSNTDSEASWSQLLPILSPPQDLTRKAYLIPGIITVIFVVLLFFVQGRTYQFLLGSYLAGAVLYFVYRLCGKPKPWWVLIASIIFTIVILASPILHLFIFVFRVLLPGNVPNDPSTLPFPQLFIRYFFGAGLLEELLKALPIFVFYFLGRILSSPKRERIGVWEPLDGILLGSASAVGFTLFETLGQYVPGTVAQVAREMGEQAGLLAGLELLIPRILGEVAGHLAWSGWFGYCIGLSILKPRQAWRTLIVGYLSAAALHGLWNSSAGLADSLGIFVLGLLVVVGGMSYVLLGSAIIKARSLSPTRSQNFATRFHGS
ncbi:PrsW family intramembrane metalloprotease [Scytonema sp. UIC 10036]|uniref:PrsW family glutamic-type intramembrane protease n=1 Tax=Scytonema sp. UIC 10036 TaxID=2304196 RepID=UPI0012DA0324|nr:PrsW family glutamic-type intramembrane protease [Scytonema sp. UIC 10036]MUG98324.1 PrsW family intramembrane metalloprotease [Scytonema sp. UIC 10036]